MNAFFEIVVGAVLVMAGVKVLWLPQFVVMGYQVETMSFGKPLGIFLCLAGFLWIWVGVKRKTGSGR